MTKTFRDVVVRNKFDFFDHNLGKRMSFDPTKHLSPKFDIYGNPKQRVLTAGDDNYNNGVFDKSIRIPANWNGPNPGKTRTKLFADYKAEFLPHPSFDIDGDGIVGGRDLVIAKKFDLDRDGILNEQEKK